MRTVFRTNSGVPYVTNAARERDDLPFLVLPFSELLMFLMDQPDKPSIIWMVWMSWWNLQDLRPKPARAVSLAILLLLSWGKIISATNGTNQGNMTTELGDVITVNWVILCQHQGIIVGGPLFPTELLFLSWKTSLKTTATMVHPHDDSIGIPWKSNFWR